jgi:deoxyribonuclease V
MHAWSVSPKEAIEIQKNLREKVELSALPGPVHTIAGVDVSMSRFSDMLYAGVIVLSYPDLMVLDTSTISEKITFPYIPGLLSFREIPSLLKCFEKLSVSPDVIMVDGQGIAHPRRLGIASHLGIVLEKPTIGCAKSKLYGQAAEPLMPGEMLPLIDPKTQETLGMVIKVKPRAKPIIVSSGHKSHLLSLVRLLKFACGDTASLSQRALHMNSSMRLGGERCKEHGRIRLSNNGTNRNNMAGGI